MKTAAKLWIGLGILILLSPLGLILPQHFKAGDAWGEWGIDAIKEMAGYVPQGLHRFSGLWSAPIPDYAFKGWQESGLAHLSLGYIISGVVGVILIVALTLLIGKILTRKGSR